MPILARLKRFAGRLIHPPLPLATVPHVIPFELNGHLFQFWIADDTGAQWYSHQEDWQHAAEPRELAALVQLGDRVLEIGCHHGLLTVLLAHTVGPTGFVLGVEAHPRTALVAQAQVTLNRLGQVCHVAHLAVSDSAGTLSFRDESCSVVLGETEERALCVAAVTGDQLADEYGPFDVLKIDVEGFEGKVLQGCPRLLAARPRIALELHRAALAQYGTSVEQLFKVLDVDHYEGTVMLRDFTTVLPFDPDRLPEDEIVNLFLRPKPVAARSPSAGR